MARVSGVIVLGPWEVQNVGNSSLKKDSGEQWKYSHSGDINMFFGDHCLYLRGRDMSGNNHERQHRSHILTVGFPEAFGKQMWHS